MNKNGHLNGQYSAWTPVLAGCPHSSILGSLFFLIYINDFAEGISIFSVVNNINVCADKMNQDFEIYQFGRISGTSLIKFILQKKLQKQGTGVMKKLNNAFSKNCFIN